MIKINVHEAKTHLSKYLQRLARGERILICKRNKPVAEIRSLAADETPKPRHTGWAKGQFKLTEDFFKPLPPEILGPFSGEQA